MMFVWDGGFWLDLNLSIWENKLSMGLFGGLGSVQISPLMMVEDAKGSRSVSVSSEYGFSSTGCSVSSPVLRLSSCLVR